MTKESEPITVFATRITSNPPITVRVPHGLNPGDSFTVTRDDRSGEIFNVIVPQHAAPNSLIQVVIPGNVDQEDDLDDTSLRSCNPSLTKTNVGAALAGGLVGMLLMGPIVGLILAGGAAYATTYNEGSIGHYARIIGDTTFRNASLTKKWAEAESRKLFSRTDSSANTPEATTSGCRDI